MSEKTHVLYYKAKKKSNLAFASHAFRSQKETRNYWLLLLFLLLLSVLSTYGLLTYNNPVAIDSPSFIPVVQRRMNGVIAMMVAATCHSLSTIAFQSITNNRIITPSLLGYEALYSAIHTALIFFFGSSALIHFTGTSAFVIQILLMVFFSLLIFGWLLSDKYNNLHMMLLLGIVIGTGLRSLSSFMRRMLEPSEFDILQAKLFGSVNNADASTYNIAIPLVVFVAILLFAYAKHLNILALGKKTAINLGLNYRFSVVYTLILITILMSVSTALVGQITFLGFLAATLTHQLVPSYDHRYLLPMSLIISYLMLTAAYFLLYHVFDAQGVVTIIIELFGGITFIAVLLKRGKL